MKNNVDKNWEKAASKIEQTKNNKEYLRTGKINGEDFDHHDDKEGTVIRAQVRKAHKSYNIYLMFFSIIFIGLICYGIYVAFNRYYRLIDKNPNINESSVHYFNDLYMSQGNLFDTLLSEDEKMTYLAWVKSIKNFDKTYTVDTKNFPGKTELEIENSIHKIFDIIQMEHPEIVYYDSYILENTGSGNNYELTIINQYTVPFKFLANLKVARCERMVDSLVKDWQMQSELNKIKAVYDFLANKKPTMVAGKGYKNAYGALIEDSASGESMAYAAQILFQRLGIYSKIAIGYKDSERYFNVIRLDDGYYYFDALAGQEANMQKSGANFYAGMLLPNYYDYSIALYEIDEADMGSKYIYQGL